MTKSEYIIEIIYFFTSGATCNHYYKIRTDGQLASDVTKPAYGRDFFRDMCNPRAGIILSTAFAIKNEYYSQILLSLKL